MITLAALLTVGFVSLTPGAAVNASWPIVATCDPTTVTDSMTLVGSSGESASFGISALAGGVWNSLVLSNFGFPSFEGRNLVATGAGRSGQWAEWDWAHNLSYNPTQGGAAKTSCTQTTVTRSTRQLKVNQFDVALWVDAIRSEQDVSLVYTDRSSMFGVPGVQINILSGYVSQPSAIQAYTFNPQLSIVDVDPTIPGNQTTTSNDLSLQIAQWILYLHSADFPYVIWKSGGVWQIHAVSGTNFNCPIGVRNSSFTFVNGSTAAIHNYAACGSGIDNEMMCQSTGTDPDASLAICMRLPENGADDTNNLLQSHSVKNSISEVSVTDTPKNLLVEAFFRSLDSSTADDGHLSLLAAFTNNAGVLKPDDWQATSMQVYELIGSPTNCAAALGNWLTHGYTGGEAP